MADQGGPLARIAPQATDAACALALAMILGLVGYYMFEAWPAIDDLARAATARDVPLVDAVSREYARWTGRWSGVGLSYFISGAVDLYRWYPALLLCNALVTIVAAYALLRHLVGAGVSRTKCGLAATAFFALYWLGMPDPGQSIYWLTGAIENCLSISCALLIVVATARNRSGARLHQRIASSVALGVAAAVVAGMHELFGVLLGAILIAGTTCAFALGRGDKLCWSTVTGMLGLGVAFVVMAPGNQVRQDFYEGGGDLAATWSALQEQLTMVGSWILDPRLLALTALFAVHVARRADLPWGRWQRAPFRWLVPLVLLLVLGAGFAAPPWAMGEAPPPRTTNGLYLIFLVGWFVWISAVAPPLRERLAGRGGTFLRFLAGVTFVLCSGLPGALMATPDAGKPAPSRDGRGAFVTAATWAIQDLPRVDAFRSAVRAQVERLQQAAENGETNVVLMPLPTVPRLLRSPEVDRLPHNPASFSVARYHGLREVRGPDPERGEYLLSQEVMGRLDHLGPQVDDPKQGGLFALWSNLWFRLRPPPPELGRSTVEIHFDRDPNSPEPIGMTVEVFIAPRQSAVLLAVELALLDDVGRVLAETVHDVSEMGAWVPLSLRAPRGNTFRRIRISSAYPPGDDGIRPIWSQFRAVRLVWPER